MTEENNPLKRSTWEWVRLIAGLVAFGFMLYANVFIEGVEFHPMLMAIPGLLIGGDFKSMFQGWKK